MERKTVVVEKGKLAVYDGEHVVLKARKSEMQGRIDLMRFEGMIEHPSLAQAKKMLASAGVTAKDFEKAFG